MKKRLFRLIPIVLVMAGLAGSSFAQERSRAPRLSRDRFPLCLMALDLTADQKVQVQSILQAAWPELQVDLAAVKTAHDALRAALDAQPADACTVGGAALGVEASLQEVRRDLEGVRDQLAGVLTPEQLARLEGCLDAPFGDGDLTNLLSGDALTQGGLSR